MTAATATPAAPAPVAGLLRRIADALPTMEGYTGEDAAALRQHAEAQQKKEEYDAWVRAEVEASLADPRPSLTTKQVEEHLEALLDRMRVGADDDEYGFGDALHAVAKRNGVTDDDVDALLAAMRSSPARQPAEPVQLP